MKHYFILFIIFLSSCAIRTSAQYGCQLPNTGCTEDWIEWTDGVLYNVPLPSNNGSPCIVAQMGVRYQRRCNEFRIGEVSFDKPDCYDEAFDNNPVGHSDANRINHAIQGLLKSFFVQEHSSYVISNLCPPYGSTSTTYSASFASCFKEVWTVIWYTTNPSGGPLIMHTHDFDILKTIKYDITTGTITHNYGDIVREYMESQGIYALGGYPKPYSIHSRYIPCSDYCCILEYSFCYDADTEQPHEVVTTLTNYIPSNQNCNPFDIECYIQTCQ